MGGGNSANQSASTTSTPSPQQQQLIDAGMPFAGNYAKQGGVTLPDQAPIAGFTPSQIAGQTLALNAAKPQTDVVQDAASGTNFLTSGAALNPSTNAGLSGAIQAALLPIQQNFQQTVVPSIDSGAAGVGGFGGSRAEIAKGIASQAEQAQVAGVTSSMENQNYQNQMDNLVKAAAISPAIAQGLTIPAATSSAVGDVQQALAQQGLSYDFSKDVFAQQQPLSVAESLLGLSGSIPGGTSTSTGTTTGSTSPLNTAMGIASIGSSLFGGANSILGGLGGAGGAASGALGSLGTGIGSLGAGLGSALGGIGSGIAGGLGAMGSGVASLLPLLAI